MKIINETNLTNWHELLIAISIACITQLYMIIGSQNVNAVTSWHDWLLATVIAVGAAGARAGVAYLVAHSVPNSQTAPEPATSSNPTGPVVVNVHLDGQKIADAIGLTKDASVSQDAQVSASEPAKVDATVDVTPTSTSGQP